MRCSLLRVLYYRCHTQLSTALHSNLQASLAEASDPVYLSLSALRLRQSACIDICHLRNEDATPNADLYYLPLHHGFFHWITVHVSPQRLGFYLRAIHSWQVVSVSRAPSLRHSPLCGSRISELLQSPANSINALIICALHIKITQVSTSIHLARQPRISEAAGRVGRKPSRYSTHSVHGSGKLRFLFLPEVGRHREFLRRCRSLLPCPVEPKWDISQGGEL